MATIRTALLGNLPTAVPQVSHWLHREWFQALGFSPVLTEALVHRRRSRDRAPLALVALAANEAVGMASIVEDTHPVYHVPGWCLSGVYVLPDRRGEGIGTRLCLRAQREARRLGLASLGLYTADCQDFYARLGWRHSADACVQGASGSQAVSFMEFRLPPSVPCSPIHSRSCKCPPTRINARFSA